MNNARFVALVAGVGFFFLALVTQGVLPFLEPSATTTHVTAVVRNDLGQLKWMQTSATDYTPLQNSGRRIYLREGCWYCHSQYVRPVTGETRRWGPVSEAGEYAYRRAASVRHAAHRSGSDPGGAQIRRRVASGAFLESADAHAGLHHGRRIAGLFDAPQEPVKIVDDEAGNHTLETHRSHRRGCSTSPARSR